MSISVLIADDHGIVRAGLRSVLNAEPDLRVVAEAADGHEALRLATELRPDVIIADISMPGPSGIEVAREVKQRLPATAVLVLTMHEDRGLMQAAQQAGASGYIVKRSVESELIQAIRSVVAGETYFVAGLGPLGPQMEAPRALSPAVLSLLDSAEVDVLKLVARGYTDAQIAESLGIAPPAVEQQRSAVTRKLGLHGRVDAIRFARERGLV